jgi:hypothetical protein
MQIMEVCHNKIVSASSHADIEPRYRSEGLIRYNGTHIEFLLTCLPCGPQGCIKICFGCQAAMWARCAEDEANGHVSVITGAHPITFSYTGGVLRSFYKLGA